MCGVRSGYGDLAIALELAEHRETPCVQRDAVNEESEANRAQKEQ